ncbi:MAG: histone deacetylase family protein [Betaproteobacteria bacterium]|nr:histone deacetylase family protein [Betaproteobacteria bacterium]
MTTAVYTHPDCKKHEMGAYHPESPARIEVIEERLAATGTDRHLVFREAPLADVTDIERVHSSISINLVRDYQPKMAGQYFSVDADTLLNKYSWRAALRAAGAAVAATKAVIEGEIDNAFCLVRPIGHHARLHTPMGFCLFNNVAIAARYATDVCGLKKVAIVDFDVHHGNGTEEAFSREPRVMMASFFQSPFYPYTRTDKTLPNMVNIPVPAGTKGDAVRHLVMTKWLPALHDFAPEMLFISAGFDAHKDDVVGGMQLIEEDYVWLTQQIMAVAKQHARGRIVSFLEGGYSRLALAKSAVAHIRTLAGLDE